MRKILVLLVLLVVQLAQAAGDKIISYRVEREAVVSSDFVHRLTSLPAWTPFCDAFAGALAKALRKELPSDVVDTLIASVGTLVKHIDTVVVDIRESERANNVDAVVAFIVDVNPRDMLSWLKFNIIVDDENGFVATFHTLHEGRHIDFGCAGVKLSGNSRYALLLAGTQNIVHSYESFVESDGARHELIVYEPAFRYSGEGAELKVNKMRIAAQDVSGVSQLVFDVTMDSADDANNIRDVLAGLLGFVRLMPVDKQPQATRDAIAFISSIKVHVDGETVGIIIRLDGKRLWSLIGQGLIEATEKINKL